MATTTNDEIHQEWLALSIQRLLEIKAAAENNGNWLMASKADHYLALKPQQFARSFKL